MPAPLSSADIQGVADCSREVLSALDAPSAEEWASRVIARAIPLLRADRMFIVLPAGQGFSLHFSDAEMQEAAAAYQAHFHATDIWTTARRKALGLNVYSHDMLLRRGEERSEFWTDYILAHRLYQPAGLSCDVDGYPLPASLIGYKRAPNATPFGDRELQILHVLQPVFASAVKTLERFRAAARELESCVDRLPIPVLLIGLGRVTHANAAFSRTLGPAADSVAAALTPTAQKCLRDGNHVSGRRAAGIVAGPGGRPIPWSLSLLSHFASGPVALVHFHSLPSVRVTSDVQERFGLTPRQAEVAELMADGRTYREIAVALGIRPKTARHHWEQVLQRLGIHSKSEVRSTLCDTGFDDT